MIRVQLSDGTPLGSVALDALRGSPRAEQPVAAPRRATLAPLLAQLPAEPLPPGSALTADERLELEAALQRARRLHAKYAPSRG